MFSSHDGQRTIGEVAEHMGVSVETVRFHSDGRLLPEVSHSACGHRRYAPEAAERLSLIRSLRGLDPPVPEVRRILDEGCWRRGRHAGGRRRRPAAPADCAWSGRSPLHPAQLAGRPVASTCQGTCSMEPPRRVVVMRPAFRSTVAG